MIQVPVDDSASPKQRLDRFLSALLRVEKDETASKIEALKREKQQIESAIAALQKMKRKRKGSRP